VITDARVTKADTKKLNAYLTAIRARELFKDEDIIFREDLERGCRELDLAFNTLTGEELQRVVGHLRGIPTEDVGVIGLEAKELLSGLITGLLSGVADLEKRQYYEKVIENLVSEGKIPEPIAEELERRKDHIFDKDDMEFRSYIEELEEERGRIKEAAESAKSA